MDAPKTNGEGSSVPSIAIDSSSGDLAGEGSSSSGIRRDESPAAALQRKHESHTVTVEDIPDEEDLAHPGSKSAIATGTATPVVEPVGDGGSSFAKPAGKKSNNFDITSADAFPSLGAGKKPMVSSATPTWGAKTNGTSAGGTVGSSGASVTSSSGTSTPALGGGGVGSNSGTTAPRNPQSFAGKEVTSIYQISAEQQLPRTSWKKPLSDVCRDIMKNTSTKIQASTSSNGLTTFIIKGEPEQVHKARRGIANAIALRESIKLTIPASVRKYIIGTKGQTVQAISARSGAKIQIPPSEEAPANDDPYAEDETTVEISIDGDHEGVALAKTEIQKIVAERTANITMRLPKEDYPGKFYPFIAGAHNVNISRWEDGKDIKVHVPHYYESSSSKELSPAEYPITIKGEKNAVHETRAEIEKIVNELRSNFGTLPIRVPKPQHRFVIGERGKSIQEILEESGCSVILPPSTVPSDSIMVTGPTTKLGNGVTSVMKKAQSMHYDSIDISKAHKEHFKDAAEQRQHARDVARFFRKRREMQRLENELEVQISAPKTDVLYDPTTGVLFEIVGKDKDQVKQARTQLVQLVNYHPPQRLAYIDIDPLLHRHIIGAKGRNIQKVKEDHLVEVLFADEGDEDSQVVLIYEGENGPNAGVEAQVAMAALATVTEILQKAASEQADLTTKVLPVPSKFHNKVIGPKGTTLNSFLGADPIVRVIVGAPKSKAALAAMTAAQQSAADDTITVRGPSKDVERVSKAILEFVEETKHSEIMNSYTTSFEFPQKYQKNLVGKGGSNISKYREELGVQIDLEGNTVNIKGIKRNVEEAKKRIQALAERLEDDTTNTIKVAPEYHRTIIGQGGKFVKRLEDKYNVRINFPKANKQEPSDTASDAGAGHQLHLAADEVMIRGPSKGVKDTKDEITELLKYEQEHGHTATFTVPAKVLPYIIGASGKAINQIREDTGATINLPPIGSSGDDENVEIKVRGTKAQVEDAKKAILANSSEIQKNITKTIDVDKKYHRVLIGQGGQTLSNMVVAAGGPSERVSQARMIRFPGQDSTDNSIRVEGHEDIVNKIIAEIEKLVTREKEKTTKTVDVHPEKHRKLIGREGTTRKQIESKHNVMVDIPRQRQDGPASSEIKVVGLDADVEAAIAYILELTKDEDSASVVVPRRLHHSLFDGGNYTRKLRSNHHIYVDFVGDIPKRPSGQAKSKQRLPARMPLITDEDQDAITFDIETDEVSTDEGDLEWVLRGLTANIAAAKEEVERDLAKELVTGVTGYLMIPDTSKFRYIVGPGGSNINNVRSETGCRVQIPKENAVGEPIVLKGSQEGVENAKDMILKLVNNAGSGGGGPRRGRGGDGDNRGGRRGGSP